MLTSKQIKFIKSLSLKKNRILHKCFIVEGEKIISDLLKSSFEILDLYASDKWNNSEVDYIKLSSKELQRISQFKNANKVIAIVKIPEKIILKDTGVTLVLDQIQDPGNFGTIIRICDWFGVKQIICSNDTVDMYNSKVVQSSMGSIFRVNIFYKNLTEYLKNVNNPVYATLKNGNSIKKIKKNKNCHIIIGNESRGISNNLFSYVDEKFSINQTSSDVDSLNVAVATGIILYDFCA